jgi:chromosome partitioning protein
MAKTIAFSNQKGGVTKTTSSVVFGFGLAKRKNRVLLIDLDPQGNLTDFVGATGKSDKTIYDVLKKDIPISKAIVKMDNFDVVTANRDLFSADLDFNSIGKEFRLKEALESVQDDYDYIIVDTGPALNILTVNAFTACDEIIIPTTASIFAINGIAVLFETISVIKKYTNPKLKIRGVLITKYNPRTIISRELKELTETLSTQMRTQVFDSFIRFSVIVEEAQANQKDLLGLNKDNPVINDYNKFIDEYLSGRGA